MKETQLQSKIKKTLIIQDEKTNKITILNQVDIQLYQKQIDFLSIVQKAIPNLSKKLIKIYDFNSNKYIILDNLSTYKNNSVSFINQNHDVILIKYSSKQIETQSLFSYQSDKYISKSQNRQKKSERSKERTILQVIQIVKQWRQLCESRRGASINLSQAAQIVGFPKKSLDDYYYQLRMGEKYGFDFHSNIYDRVGKLRTFLRSFKSNRKLQKNEKLPQHLKIIQEIQQYQKIRQKQIASQRYANKKSSHIQSQNENVSIQNRVDEDIFQRQIGIQNDFYREFNYNFGNEIDPFISLKQNDNSFQERYFNFQKMQQQNNDKQFNMF